MAKVFLGDVVDHIKDKVNKDETDLEFYVGGEHIEGREIVVRQKGLIQGSTIGPAFHMRFQKGDVLLMSRNPHLCKASMVDFDGICSDVSYVCRTKDNNILLQSLLPFIMQTDEFWQFAEENKKGGLPFFLNWKDFARFEFELIPIDQQRKISDLLWAVERAKNAYKDLIKKTDDLVKSQFIEAIKPLLDNKTTIPLDDLVEDDRPITYGILKPGTGFTGGVPVVKVKDMRNGIIDQSDLLLTSPEIDKSYKRSRLRAGDLLISIRGSVGRMAEVPANLENANITQDTARLSIKPEYNKIFVKGVLESQPIQYDMEKNIRGVAVKGINIGYLRQLGIPVCERREQDRLAEIYQQSDKSKFAAKQALDNLNASQKALMNQIFGE